MSCCSAGSTNDRTGGSIKAQSGFDEPFDLNVPTSEGKGENVWPFGKFTELVMGCLRLYPPLFALARSFRIRLFMSDNTRR